VEHVEEHVRSHVKDLRDVSDLNVPAVYLTVISIGCKADRCTARRFRAPATNNALENTEFLRVTQRSGDEDNI